MRGSDVAHLEAIDAPSLRHKVVVVVQFARLDHLIKLCSYTDIVQFLWAILLWCL